jgi:hypothetical protein
MEKIIIERGEKTVENTSARKLLFTGILMSPQKN